MPNEQHKRTPLARRLFRKRPSRKYAIKRDKEGRSLRRRAFDLFNQGKGPAEVAKELSAKLKTIYRYRVDWRKQKWQGPYADLRKELKLDPEFNESVMTMLMNTLGMTRGEVTAELQKPWGLMNYLKGGWPNRRLERSQREIQARLEAALKLIKTSEALGNDLKKVGKRLNDLLLRAGRASDSATDPEPAPETDEERRAREEAEQLARWTPHKRRR